MLNIVALWHTVNMSDTPKKITRNRPVNYPRQVIIMTSDELADAIEATAEEERTSKSVVARRWLERGRNEERFDLAADQVARGEVHNGKRRGR